MFYFFRKLIPCIFVNNRPTDQQGFDSHRKVTNNQLFIQIILYKFIKQITHNTTNKAHFVGRNNQQEKKQRKELKTTRPTATNKTTPFL